MDVTLLVPVKNEIDGLKAIMSTIPRALFSQILIVDGQSTDGSAEWAASNGYEVYVQRKPGIRHGYIEAWPLVRGKHVITFSPDGNCKVEDLPLLLEKLEQGYDMVIASRYLPPAKSEDDTFVTGFGNWLFTALINVLHRGRYTDSMTMYRGYRSAMFYELELHKDEAYLPERLFKTICGIEPLLSVRALKRRLKVTDVPSDEPNRMHGVRKLQVVRWGATYLAQIFRELVYWR